MYGLAFPLITPSLMGIIVNSVEASRRGMASAICSWARQLGNSLGVALFAALIGCINNQRLTHFLHHASKSLSVLQGNSSLDGILIKSRAAVQATQLLSQQEFDQLHAAAIDAYTYHGNRTELTVRIIRVKDLLVTPYPIFPIN